MYYARNTRTHRNCMQLIEGKEDRIFIVFDTETTGLDPQKDYIVELAALKYQIKEQKPVLLEQLNLYIRPPFAMDDKIIEIHHITNEFLSNYPEEFMQFPDIREFFGTRPILLGYNVEFDVEMLNTLYARQGQDLFPEVVIDIREMGYDLLHDKDFKDHKLGTLVSVLGLDTDLNFHNALDDAIASFRLLMYCYNEYKKIPLKSNLEQVYVNTMYYWKGYRKEQAGIYLKTNLGKMYYSTYLKQWCSSEIDLSIIDIDTLEKGIIFKTQIPMKELGKMTEKKFKELKISCMQRGVYL